MKVFRAIAHPNIALAKYWGKRDGTSDVPAVPSLSVTLDGLATRTQVTLDASLAEDRFVLGGVVQHGEAARRNAAWLDALRAHTGRRERALVESHNDFPTASGLASSASGFAALAVAGCAAYGLELTAAELAGWAQRGSTSAARSLFAGFAELVPGEQARQVAGPEHLPVEVLVCVTTEAEKELSSRSAMADTRKHSPYYDAWIEFAHRNFATQRAALLAGDWPTLGAALEASAFAMHASAMAAGIVYFNEATLRVAAAVRALRARGVSAWASMDAGPHVKVFVRAAEARAAEAELVTVPGVLRVLAARPGAGARLLS